MSISYSIGLKTAEQLKHLEIELAKKNELLKSLPKNTLKYLAKQAFISTIGASTRIENAVLTDSQIEWVDTILTQDGKKTAFLEKKNQIANKIAKDRERSLEEVAGCREMLRIIYSQGRDLFPLTEVVIRGLHQVLLQYYPPAVHYLGKYKTHPNRVVEKNRFTGEERSILNTTDAGPITAAAMSNLIIWYNETLPVHPWPIAVASEFVFRFLAIHPFQDGNGRLGRSLFLLTLIQSKENYVSEMVPYLSIDRFLEQNKEEYYWVLATTSGGKYDPDPAQYKLEIFLLFMIKAIKSALTGIDLYLKKHDFITKLSPSASKVLQSFKDKPEKILYRREIVEETGIHQRTVTRALNALVKHGILQRYGQAAGTRYQLIF